MRKILYLIPILGIVLLIIFSFDSLLTPSNEKKKNKQYQVINTWELPDALEEISGISWLSEGQVAAIEDEHGIIYLYDLTSGKIKRAIDFADDGDYEGVAVVQHDAYVMRSDGLLFEIRNYTSDTFDIKSYQTPLDEEHNVESLTYDAAHKRLLFMAKDEGKDSKTVKQIYAFDIASKKLLPFSNLKLDMEDKALKDFEKKKEKHTFRPSDIAVHPKTGAIYILEGADPKLLILDKTGEIKTVFELDTDDFRQPEGISFSPDGTLYIANEARGKTATLVEVELEKAF